MGTKGGRLSRYGAIYRSVSRSYGILGKFVLLNHFFNDKLRSILLTKLSLSEPPILFLIRLLRGFVSIFPGFHDSSTSFVGSCNHLFLRRHFCRKSFSVMIHGIIRFLGSEPTLPYHQHVLCKTIRKG